MKISGSPIGVFLTPFKNVGQMPFQSGGSGIEVVIDIFPQHQTMLNGLKKCHHLIVAYHCHGQGKNGHVETPFRNTDKHGIFASESAKYRKPLGLSLIRLKGILGSLLIVQGIDVLDQTPVLDIKPYINDFDMCDAKRFGWFEEKSCRQKRSDCHAEWSAH